MPDKQALSQSCMTGSLQKQPGLFQTTSGSYEGQGRASDVGATDQHQNMIIDTRMVCEDAPGQAVL